MIISRKLYSQGAEKIQQGKSKTGTTPLVGHFKLSSKQYSQSLEEKEEMSYVTYASAVGSLMYDMVCIMPA